MSSTEKHLKVLRLLQEQPDITQRQMAQQLGISLGGLNYCLKALVEKGWVKIDNFSSSQHRWRYAYVLTPTGLAEKAALTGRFLKRKMAEYEALKAEIDALKAETDMTAPDEAVTASITSNTGPQAT